MIARIEVIVRRLKAGSAVKASNWVREFETGLAEISELNEPCCIPLLMELLEDNATSDDLMFSIIHAIEKFDDATYISYLLRETGTLARRAPRWLMVLYMRVLNSESAREQLVMQIKGASADVRELVVGLLDSIVARRPEFARKTIAVRSAAVTLTK